MASRKKRPAKNAASGRAKKRAPGAKKKSAKKPSAKKAAAKKPLARKADRQTPPRPAPHPRQRAVRRTLPPGPRRKLGMSPYDSGLDRNPANYQPLTPLSHLERAAATHPDTIAVIHGK